MSPDQRDWKVKSIASCFPNGHKTLGKQVMNWPNCPPYRSLSGVAFHKGDKKEASCKVCYHPTRMESTKQPYNPQNAKGMYYFPW